MKHLRSSLRLLVLLGALWSSLLAAGCQAPTAPPEYVARVGDQYLRPDQLHAALRPLPAGADSTAARRQVIRQWTTDALLYREAQRRGLAQDPDVQARLEETRHSVLVNALLEQFYGELSAEPTPEAVRTYFQQHRETLRLREPHARIRHLATDTRAGAQAAHRRLQAALDQGHADSTWATLVRRYAADTARARRWAARPHAVATLFSSRPALKNRFADLSAPQLAPVFEAAGRYHVLQLVERVPAGTLPRLPWVRGEVRRRLVLQRRKQMYARQVERLRSQARSRGELDGDV